MSRCVLREAVAVLLFFGSFAHDPSFKSAADLAARALERRGYTLGESIRIYPADNSRGLEGTHAGTSIPGIVRLRSDPQSDFTAAVYLRHELFHQASLHTCNGRRQLWADEAGAIAFSGESAGATPYDVEDLKLLKRSIETDAPIRGRDYQTLRALVATFGWPEEPCKTSPEIEKLLAKPSNSSLEYILMSLTSARIREQHSTNESAPLGSLMKIFYAAALKDAPSLPVGNELARSDTAALALRRAALDEAIYGEIIGATAASPAVPTETYVLLGERTENGEFPLKYTLEEAARAARVALLLTPERFSQLQNNGTLPGSTLEKADPSALNILRSIRALAKTGTISNAHGDPQIGYLMLAWPADAPSYLAIFRQHGTRGSAVLRSATKILEQWKKSLPSSDTVRVRLLPLLRPDQYSIVEPCLGVGGNYRGEKIRATRCGQFQIKTEVPSAKPLRNVHGVLSRNGRALVLSTDVETYADGVLRAEAADLRGSAREALRAVVIWNGLHGRTRHSESNSLCDLTHCMVFQGDPPASEVRDNLNSSTGSLLRFLEATTAAQKAPWLPFSAGGTEPWQARFSAASLAAAFKEALVLSITRERARDGSVIFHLEYPSGSETLPCERVRTALGLASCPESVTQGGNTVQFTGHGSGHGLGFDIARAREMASEGRTAIEILEEFFGQFGSKRVDMKMRKP